MRFLSIICCMAMFCTFPCFSATILHGEVNDMVYDMKGNPYIIDSTITIPKNGTVVFREGCIVLVKPFCGIDVYGNFIVRGTAKSPVIFTTVNDNRYNPQSENFPQPLDWNGITVQLTSDTVFFENFSLMYSVYGIKSWNSRISLHNGTFSDNGQYNLVINDELQAVEPGVSYTHNYQPPSKDTLSLKTKLFLYEQKVQKRKTFTLITLVGGLAGAGFDGFAWYKFIDYRNNVIPSLSKDFEEPKRKKANWKTAATIAAPCGGTLLLASLLMYVVPVRGAPVADEKKVSFEIYSAPQGTGVALCIPLRRSLSTDNP